MKIAGDKHIRIEVYVNGKLWGYKLNAKSWHKQH